MPLLKCRDENAYIELTLRSFEASSSETRNTETIPQVPPSGFRAECGPGSRSAVNDREEYKEDCNLYSNSPNVGAVGSAMKSFEPEFRKYM